MYVVSIIIFERDRVHAATSNTIRDHAFPYSPRARARARVSDGGTVKSERERVAELETNGIQLIIRDTRNFDIHHFMSDVNK